MLTEEELMRLLGCANGYAHCIVAIKMKIGEYDSSNRGRFEKHHVRKIAQRDAITKPMRELFDRLMGEYKSAMAAYEAGRAMITASETNLISRELTRATKD